MPTERRDLLRKIIFLHGGVSPDRIHQFRFRDGRTAIRNAAKYGRAEKDAPLRLEISAQAENEFCLAVADNGTGLNGAQHSTGSGQGLALHGTMMAVVGGKLAVENNLPQGVRVELRLPLGDASKLT